MSVSNSYGITISKVSYEVPECPPGKESGKIIIEASYKGVGILEYSIDEGTTYDRSPIFDDLKPGKYVIVVRLLDNPKSALKYTEVDLPTPNCPENCDHIDTSCGTILFPGDLMISGFDNNIHYGTDRILVTTIVELKTNTSFAIANAIYEAETVAGERSDKWYASASNDPDGIASHRIIYTGRNPISAGSIICFDLPSHDCGSGMLAQNFSINGEASNDFCVSNNGHKYNDRVNISTTKPDAIFLLQGEWEFKTSHAKFCGRPISAIQHGALWLTITDAVPFPGRVSRYHPLIKCFSIQGLHYPSNFVGYFEPLQSVYYPINFNDDVMTLKNWKQLRQTGQNDLPPEACRNTFRVGNPCAPVLP